VTGHRRLKLAPSVSVPGRPRAEYSHFGDVLAGGLLRDEREEVLCSVWSRYGLLFAASEVLDRDRI
jgi:hypothetical protein